MSGGGGGLGLMVAEMLLEVHPSVCPSLRHHCLPSILLSSVPPSLRLFSASSSSPSRHFCFSSTRLAASVGVSHFHNLSTEGPKRSPSIFGQLALRAFFFFSKKQNKTPDNLQVSMMLRCSLFSEISSTFPSAARSPRVSFSTLFCLFLPEATYCFGSLSLVPQLC